jgi:uncharacterized membrane protein YqaE (UPF0057 family)
VFLGRSYQICSQALGSDIFSPPPYSAEIKEIEKMSDGTATCIDIILAIILPPLGVFFKFGCGVEFWICLVLTFFGYLPGIIYAVWAITK